METPGFVILGELDKPRLCIGSHSEVHGPTTEPNRWLVRFESTDIRTDVSLLKAAGVEVIEEPNDQGGGFWLATCKDPDGNLVQLTHWEEGAARGFD
jgi:predicted enzyme related to lactoylglutathione lyase